MNTQEKIIKNRLGLLNLAKAKQLDQYVEEKDTNQTQSDTFLGV